MPDHKVFRASFEQERAYVTDRLTSGRTPGVHQALLVTGALSPETLTERAQRTAARHEILRTGLRDTANGLEQIIHQRCDIDLTVVTASEVDASDVARAFVARPFDLGTVPLWRVLLVQVAADRHVLVLSMHPAVGDAGTLALVLAELLGTEPGPAGRYSAHAARQHAVDAETRAAHRDHWLSLLDDEPAPAQLPLSRPRPASAEHRAGRHLEPLPDQLLADARQLADEANCSLSVVLAACFAAVLHRYGARSDVVLGHHLPGDRPAGTAGPIGDVAVLRLAMSPGTGFRTLLDETARQLTEAAAHRDHPFQHLTRALGRTPDTAAAGLFQLLFESELDTATPLAPATGLDVAHFDVPPAHVLHDAVVTARRTAAGVALCWVYDADLFEPRTIAAVARHFTSLLAAAVADPAAAVATLPMLSEEDHEEIRRHWNTARTPYRREPVHRLIEDQVRRTPDSTAVEFGAERLSYAELDRRADRLAGHLLARGAVAGDMVGLCLDRSAELVVAVLAILKAGCVVVPLDAAYPQERLEYMVTDAGVRVVITTRELAGRLPDTAGAPIRLDADEITGSAGEPGDDLGPDAAAYCIYTSGSTGQPKGVVVDHGAVANLVAWHADAWHAEPGTRVLLYSPISFDVSFHEILAGLCTGATLVQVDETTRRNPMALLDFVRANDVEKWYLPFVALQQVAQVARTAEVPTGLRELIVGGEVLRITPEIRDFARRTGCVIHNHYGSTECVDVTTHTLSGDPARWPDVAPIGRANVHNMNLYVLDDAQQLLPVAVVGELYGEGDCLARHYHGRPELTEQRFLPSPFGVQGTRLYRLGDLGRYLPDGTVECLGRVDTQLKIRGFRVEPAEVETVLAEHPAVAECVVAARTTAAGRTRLVAYVVPHAGHDSAELPEVLRARVAERLPEHFVPSAFVVLDALPLTPSGKVSVRDLPDPSSAPPATPVGSSLHTALVTRIWCELLELPHLDPRKTFFELGGDSVLLVRAHQQLCAATGVELPVETLFRHPTAETLTRFLDGQVPEAPAVTSPAARSADRDIAVVGMACRVPGAGNVSEFWANLRNGVESIRPLTAEEIVRLDPDQTTDPHFVGVGAVVDDADRFDAEFFGYSAAEAEVIDPQQRLFLECAWEAVEHAGIDPRQRRTGVYAGASMSTYLVNNVLPAKLRSGTFLSHRHFDRASELRIEQGNANDHLPTRVSFKLGLRGPSVNVQSTCSTSLVAVHLASQALLNGDCEVALAGGVSVITPQHTGYLWRDGMMLSRDGHCRAFDANAGGTVFGNGLGVVVLKRLSAALADGDHVHAVIKGSAVNNDGESKMDYSGPSAAAQADVIAQAHANAGVTADDISYVEAHGTATLLGDPIEIAGLTEAFRRTATSADIRCAIGSVKTNVGHLDEAAGVIGLIKTVLGLSHRELPPSLHFTSPNPLAGLEASPFHVNAELREWPAPDGRPRRAGVSSFGMGGTNCHVVLEEPPAVEHEPPSRDRAAHILPISARSAAALRTAAHRYIERLEGQDDVEFANICHSAATARRHFDTRVAVLASNAEDARSQLDALVARPHFPAVTSHPGDGRPALAFLFTGQGSQYARMGFSLYETQPVFRAAIDHCDEILRPLIGRSLVDTVYGTDPDPSLDETAVAQPALFAVGHALNRLWESWGIRPDLVLGHSLGEFVAACAAGVFSVEDGLKLVAARGQLMQSLPRVGGMALVNAGVEQVMPYLADHQAAVSIAAVNSPTTTVISGRADALDDVCRALRGDGVETIPLNISHAAHSPLMRPMVEPFRAVAESVRFSPPTVRVVSTVTGEPADAREWESAGYWVEHVLRPVRFDSAVRAAHRLGARAFVEMGPKPTLSNLGRQCLDAGDLLWLPSLTPKDPHAALDSLRKLHLGGADVDWHGFDAPFRRRRVQVPAYAFQRTRHWIEPKTTAGPRPAGHVQGDAEPPRTFELGWEPVAQLAATTPAVRHYVIIGATSGLAGRIARELKARGHACAEVTLSDGTGLDRELAGTAPGPDIVFVPEAANVPGTVARSLADARAIVELAVGPRAAKKLWFVTRQSELGTPTTEAELGQAGLAALARTINAEHPELDCVALTVPPVLDSHEAELVATLLGGAAPAGEEQLAVHQGRVHLARLHARPEPAGTAVPRLPIRAGGVYVITGGTGGLGLRLAVAAARLKPARIVLVSRSGHPAPEDAATWAELAATGVPVDAVRADVADAARMREVLAGCGSGLRGVFHCAGVVDDGIFLRQTPQRLSAVLRSKVDGAWLLHEFTRDHDLDFFVLFSSSASMLGYRGQASYAAANEFLDALARHRRHRGLPALSVSWGSWAESGMTARIHEAHRARLRDDGETPLSTDQGLTALATLMAGDAPHVAVANMDWTTFARSRPRVPSMIKALVEQDVEPATGTADTSYRATLRQAPPERARAILRNTVTAAVRSVLGGGADELAPTRGFADLGVDSLGALDLRGKLQVELGLSLPATLAFDHPCLDALIRHIEEEHLAEEILTMPSSGTVIEQTETRRSASPAEAERAVAIIGMSCRFPGAATPDEFWKLMSEGRDAVRDVPGDRWDVDALYDASPDAPGKIYIRQAALIDDADCFDAAFFGISPREALSMDPRHRMLLEAAWSAIEDAGIDPMSLRGTDTAVYLGGDEFANDYLRQAEPQLGTEPYISTGTTLSFTAGRLSYKLGLHGPSMVIATACSSSLVAVHSAVRAIRGGECGMAIVGGAKLVLGSEETVQLCKLRVLAPDGRSKAFAADGDGLGRGEGCAAVLLKRLDRAIADGDPVLAVIRGTAVNHDGPSSGLTVPNGGAQARLITTALADAGVAPADVTYVEAHGTGTPLGDPIEINALGAVFRDRTSPLRIGSVKANIGHLEEAAGLAGLIKTVLAVRHGIIPPQIHCDVLTDKVEWRNLPVVVERTGTAWPADAPRIAGVSSFGASGTNAHVVIEAYQSQPARTSATHDRHVFTFSARNETDLDAVLRRFVDVLPTRHDPAQVAFTLQTGRRRHRCRLAVVAPDTTVLRERLLAFLQGRTDVPGLVQGQAGEDDGLAVETLSRLVADRDLTGLAEMWCGGCEIDWQRLHEPQRPQRVSLPAYPFKRERVWINENERPRETPAPLPEPAPAAPPTVVPRHDGVIEELRGQVAGLLGMPADDLPATVPFDELGADSLIFMRVSQFIRDRFLLVISFQQLIEEASTLVELAALVTAQMPRPAPHETAPVAPAPVREPEPEFRSGPSTLLKAPQAAERLTDRQARFVTELVDAYTARTRASKEQAELDRPFMANCRMPPFQAICKEMSYPIIAERSAGPRFWDVDGNEYLDISMGYGVHLFGYQPRFIVDALQSQLADGFHIGPQSSQAGRAARLLCELTGMQRAVFCNSGTEAVMAALRFARAATKRTRFVMFEGSYHGWSDHTLALPSGTQNSIPMARGIAAGAMNDVVVLEYGAEESLETIRALGPELAAVLVEPVQSRRPDLQPKRFLQELRDLTRASGTALIFDEIVTGFRVHPGGAQVWSGVDADIVTYGKILGGGMPVGAVAGRAEFMDTVDGGQWNYGDDSTPTVPTTFFGGTFNKNPMTMAATQAVLTHLKEQGPQLQQRLAENVAWLAHDFNTFCEKEEFPLRIVHFSSVFRFIGDGEYSLQRYPMAIDLFFHLLALKGIYVLETRVCFLSTGHTQEDLRHISDTAKSCLNALRDGGFFGRAVPAARTTTRRGERFAEDARLDRGFTVPPRTTGAACGDVLLTGATGFLGAHLAHDLLRDTSARIHCLVRARDAGQARQRVIDNLAANGCLTESARDRVIGVPADLSQPRLGLSDAAWRELGGQIDAIYHNGAHVNSLLPYDKLRLANVEGTRELLRLAVDGRTKAFHYISSDAVFDAYGYLRNATIYEDQPLAHCDSLYGGGYAESKWVADKLVENARAAGLPASIYRPGTITGALAGGCGQLGDYFTRFIKGVLQLGACPEIAATIDFSPVDVVSGMIVELSRDTTSGRTFHLTHRDPITYREFIDAIRDTGYQLDVVPLHEWEPVLANLRYEDDNALYPLLPLFTESADPFFRPAKLDVRNAHAGARSRIEACPPILELIPLYLTRFAERGFLEGPPELSRRRAAS
ncbi:amino acid adenylation domain-containing protein [Lentzea sp. BCCO 10_0856]|uniref:Amino acid adenylation domain-containing protein n=1 Tax=Lentzea miocenica TaxID=3095431 RepID=A0ABU4SZN3_9PSEU|nr:non-ribosomal peptide synthetase/type I polyketide synthase [Lentzea sp. BCCO 10_0856]MDX8031365.1 amino acid adenylation domain-containing protein [Lentzea sp. BCCO 10_0856]